MKRPLVLAAIVLTAAGSVMMAGKWLPFLNSDEPDMPSFNKKESKSQFSKEQFQIMRAEGVALKRGVSKGQRFEPFMRKNAIDEMVRHQKAVRERPDSSEKDFLLASWTAVGPAPIPNGQTSPSTAVSGRVTAIAIHPTDEDIVYVGAAQGGVYRTTDGGANWTPIFDSADTLAIGSIAIAPSQPETVYVGTGEPNFSIDSYFGVGVYRIDNASTTATLSGPFNQDSGASDVFSGRSVGRILVHPTLPGTIFVSTTSGLGGIRPTGSTFPTRGIYRSTNATAGSPVFARLTTPFGNQNLSVRDMELDPNDPNNLVANVVANGGGIITTTNALAATPTFTPTLTFTGSTSDTVAEFAGVASVGAGAPTFYAATGFGGGRVYVSTDSGATWTQQIDNNFCGGQCFYDIAIAVDPTNANNVYLGGDPTITSAKSTNGGTSFTDNDAGVHVDTHALAVAASNPNIVYLGTDGGIYKSVDAGLTYTSLNNSQFSATQFMSLDLHPTDADFSLGGTQDNGTNWLQPGGAWTRADFGDGGYAVIDQNAPDTTNVRMYHTYFNATGLQGYGTVANTGLASDGNWSFRGCQVAGTTVNGITCNGSINFYAPLERGPGTPNTIYYGSDRLYRSANLGVNHTVVSQNPISAGVPISAIGISPQNDNVRMVGLNNGELWGTTTGSSTLIDLDPTNAIPNAAIARVAIDPNNVDTAYVTLSAFGVTSVWKTTTLSSLSSGLAPTWIPAATGLPQVPVNAIVIDPDMTVPNHVYVGTDIGVYYSPDGGATWQPLGTGLPRVAVFDIGLTTAPPRQVRIATHGRGLFQHPAALGPTAASVSVGGKVVTPNGSGISRAIVKITFLTGETRSARTNNFGYFKFEDIPVGDQYGVSVNHKEYRFQTRVVNVEDDITDLTITALE